MGALMKSLITTGQTVSGVCYGYGALAVAPTHADAWFQAIPPERVGLGGEYDHHGLVKRVHLAFQHAVGNDAIAHLSIRQRGSVLILHGRVASQALLDQLIHIAMQVEGMTNLEIRDVVIRPAAS
ncbi:hypothetical protein XM38_040660 [Halomicronema hongdechloris C2206]|uniref:BON domain-containing protein n=2 Tax=Halomicronema hongdechloris TaxID=1209493 RepID=A0A1Z3HS15_9CYAN|nr:hypothetical protein XM38_040660 [Halomicronema hongdechloris C2206]